MAGRRVLVQTGRILLTAGLGLGAVLLLCHALRGLDWRVMLHECWTMPWRHVALAAFCAAISYGALTFYDFIACRWVGCKIAYARVAGAALMAYAFSHTLGFPAFTGGAVRYRLYAAWGVKPADIARIMALAGVTLVVGLLTVGGFGLAFTRQSVESHLGGGVMLAVLLVYIVLGCWGRAPRIGGWKIAPPRLPVSLAQIVVGSADWLGVAGALYAVLPPVAHLSFAAFAGLFVMAYLVATISNVPGGLGIFESIILADLGPDVSAESLVSALLVYRAIYYLVPFILAGVALLIYEMKGLGRHIAKRRDDHRESDLIKIG